MRKFYFAYGSNMSRRRLESRVSEARVVGAARLEGHRLACNKPGRDGSGKANLITQEGGCVWGVVYELSSLGWSALDRFEQGYTRQAVHVILRSAQRVRARAYVWLADTPEIPTFDWYRELILEGAREHALPAEYISALKELPARPSPQSRELPAQPSRSRES